MDPQAFVEQVMRELSDEMDVWEVVETPFGILTRVS
jgi:hypothetical protein